MKESQTSTPRKVPELCSVPALSKARSDQLSSEIVHTLEKSPGRVKDLARNSLNLANLDEETEESCELNELSNNKESSTNSDIEKISDSHNENETKNQKTFITDMSKDSSRDISRDSGISEGISFQSALNSHSVESQREASSESDVNTHRFISPRSSLSDEARMWLGKRGIRLKNDSESSDTSPSGMFSLAI